MSDHDTRKQPQSSQRQPDQPQQRRQDPSMGGAPQNNPAQSGDSKDNTQDVSKKNVGQCGKLPQHQGEEEEEEGRQERVS